MPDERESPSTGWREVCEAMDADTAVEEPTHSCPDCARTCENVLRDVYECPEHGVFRPSSDEGAGSDDATADGDVGRDECEQSPGTGRTGASLGDDRDEGENRAAGDT